METWKKLKTFFKKRAAGAFIGAVSLSHTQRIIVTNTSLLEKKNKCPQQTFLASACRCQPCKCTVVDLEPYRTIHFRSRDKIKIKTIQKQKDASYYCRSQQKQQWPHKITLNIKTNQINLFVAGRCEHFPQVCYSRFALKWKNVFLMCFQISSVFWVIVCCSGELNASLSRADVRSPTHPNTVRWNQPEESSSGKSGYSTVTNEKTRYHANGEKDLSVFCTNVNEPAAHAVLFIICV